MKQRLMPGWTFVLMAILAVGIGIYAFAFYGNYDGIERQAFVTEKDIVLPALWFKALWVHAASSGIALTIGWLQFVGRLRRSKPNLHRAIGCVYAVSLTLGGVSGLYMAYYADGGWVGETGFATLAILWLYTLYRGLRSVIGDRDFAAHGRWMTRNYALTCAAIALRLYAGICAGFGLEDTNETFVVIGWACWVPNLLFAEWLIRKNERRVHRRGADKNALQL